MAPGELTARERLSALTSRFSGAGRSTEACSTIAGDNSGSSRVSDAASIFGASISTATGIFAEQSQSLAARIGQAKITYVNTDQHVAQLHPPVTRHHGHTAE